MKNKKAQTGIVIFFVILAIILVVGFVVAVLVAAGAWVSDEVTPVFTGIGIVGDTNFSHVGEVSVGTLNTIIQAAPWFVGFTYLFALLASILFVLSYDRSMNPMWLGAYFVFMIALILFAIIFSNAYQDLYEGDNEIALQLQSMTIISYLVLYSPYVFAVIAVIAGIFLFAGKQGETIQGGYGV